MADLPLYRMRRDTFEPFGTYGQIIGPDDSAHALTVERPWLGNCPYKSCIPRGLYIMKRDTFGREGTPYPDFRLLDVPGRTDIEMHGANFPHDLLGCIAPASSLGWVKLRRSGVWVIRGFDSRVALAALIEVLDGTQARLLIEERRCGAWVYS